MRALVLAAGVVILASVVACAGGGGKGEPKPAPEPQTDPWEAAGKSTKVGDVQVEFLWARIGNKLSVMGPVIKDNLYNVLTIKYRLKNTSDAKIARFAGWWNSAAVTDEHGNVYKRHAIDRQHGFLEHPGFDKAEDDGYEINNPLAVDEPIHPGKGLACFLFHEPPVAAAKEIRVTVNAKALGGEGMLRFRVPLERVNK